MRENRTYGSEGGEARAFPTPISPSPFWSSKLTADGYKVRQVKVEGGCYEVYATDKDGMRANMAFNAQTLERLDNAEAGEN